MFLSFNINSLVSSETNYLQNIMAPQLYPAWSADAWSNPAHTPTPTDSMISEQLHIIERGISASESNTILALTRLHDSTTHILAELKIKMATLRRMLEIKSSLSSSAQSSSPAAEHHESSTAPPSSYAAEPHSIAAISSPSQPTNVELPAIRC